MIREDYVMRLIRQAVEFIARAMKLREDADYDAALATADGVYDLLGVPRELCDVVDTPTLAGLLRDPEKIRVAADLFREEGHIYKAKRDPLTAFSRYRRALELYLEARAMDPKEEDASAILELSRVVAARDLDERYRP